VISLRSKDYPNASTVQLEDLPSVTWPNLQMEDTWLGFELEVAKISDYLCIVNGNPVALGELKLNTPRWFTTCNLPCVSFNDNVIKSKNGIKRFVPRKKFTKSDVVEIIQSFSASNNPRIRHIHGKGVNGIHRQIFECHSKVIYVAELFVSISIDSAVKKNITHDFIWPVNCIVGMAASYVGDQRF